MVSHDWDIETYVERYRRDSSLSEVLVEGEDDQFFIERFFRLMGLGDRVEVITPRFFQLPSDVRAQRSNKLAVEFWCRSFSERLLDCQGFTGVTDQDLEAALRPTNVSSAFLMVTDHRDMEMFLYNDEVLNEFLAGILRVLRGSEALCEMMTECLVEIALCRAASHMLGLGESQGGTNLRKEHLHVKDGRVRLRNKFRNDALASCTPQEQEACVSFIENLRSQVASADPRKVIRGHDFAYVFHWLATDFFKAKEISQLSPFSLVRTLYGILSPHQLAKETILFSQLLVRYSNQAPTS